jgi:cellulose synthase/poly-beta-1,6-N-acetylglucosamine synthase-like glycosyltransferase
LSTSLPFITVVVPAYNRPDGLKALFEAMAEQSYPPYRFEVLVCDDGSTPPLAERVPTKDCPFSVRFSRDVNQGPAAARNRGVKEARGSLIAFTDDDCLPGPAWLESVAEAMGNPTTYAVHGPTRSSVPPNGPYIHSIHITQSHGVATANFAVRQDKFQAVGGFDETFRVPYFEDEDLSRRLQAAFGALTWHEEMAVDHPPRPATVSGWFRQAKFYYFLPYMQRKYPGYMADAFPSLTKRVLVKSLLVLIGLLPLLSPFLGLPVSLAATWLIILAWQFKKLQADLKLAVIYKAKIPVATQLAFLATEWAVDFVRWSSYLKGRSLEAHQSYLDDELILE